MLKDKVCVVTGGTCGIGHATLKNGIFVGDCREMNREIGRRFNKEFVRYNTEKNKGNGRIPEILRRQ